MTATIVTRWRCDTCSRTHEADGHHIEALPAAHGWCRVQIGVVNRLTDEITAETGIACSAECAAALVRSLHSRAS